MEAEEVTLAELMRGKGYHTAYIGKWHLGDEDWFPEHQGFEVNFGGCDGATCEFRVWNQSKTQWRMLLAAATSAAMAEAAAQGKEASYKRRDSQPLFMFLGEFLTPDVLVLMQRQLHFVSYTV